MPRRLTTITIIRVFKEKPARIGVFKGNDMQNIARVVEYAFGVSIKTFISGLCTAQP